jgi:hypothetical protein
MISPRRLGLAVVVASLGAAAHASAQVPTVRAPSNVVLPNYASQAPGLTGGLEGGAAVARGDDATATWYNPAGLSRVETSSLSASGGAVQWLHVTPNAFSTNVGSTGSLPVQIGLAWKEPFNYEGWTAAISFVTENNWDHSLSSELQVGTSSAPERFAYAAASRYERRTAGIGAGYSPDQKLRLGGSADLVMTEMNEAQSINDRVTGAAAASATLVASHETARFVHLRLTFGAQYDVSDHFKIGGTVRTPGFTIANNGSAGLDASLTGGGTSVNASYYDEHPQVALRIPFEFVAGAAWSGGRSTVEGDVRITQGGGVYDLFTPSKTLTTVVTTGSTVASSDSAFRTYAVDSGSVVDLLIGARYLLSERGKLTLHGGFSTANSPVGSADEVFQAANLRRVTAGVSGETAHLTFAGGISYQTGTSTPYNVFTSQLGQAIVTTIDVSGIAFTYSVAVRF